MKARHPPSARLTRRELAGAIMATAAAAQTPPSQPSTAAEELQAAQEQNRRTAATLAKAEIAMDTEPAFHFTA